MKYLSIYAYIHDGMLKKEVREIKIEQGLWLGTLVGTQVITFGTRVQLTCSTHLLGFPVSFG